MSIKAINFESIPVRLAASGAAGLVVLISFFTFIWGFASSSSSNAEFKEVSDLFVSLSPSDPQTHYAAASLRERVLEPGDFEIALREYEIAASLAPNNYLLWLRLASVRGRAGDTPGAEAALLQAKLLAPNYSRVQWAWGNFLLREGRDDEAYKELRNAVAGDPTLAPLAAATALQMSDGDASIVSSRFQNSPAINVALAVQLSEQKRFEEALGLWNRVDIADERYTEAGKRIRAQLIENKKFRLAVTMKDAATSGPVDVFEKITNAGFESPVKTDGADVFDWKVSRGTYPQIGITDTQKLAGNYSMVVLLGGQEVKEFRGPSLIIAVRPGFSYELVIPYRSDVKSASSFHWEIVSTIDGRRLAISSPLESNPQWTKASVGFTVPPGNDAIEIRFVRGDCIGSKCAATGSYWFDDISLNAK